MDGELKLWEPFSVIVIVDRKDIYWCIIAISNGTPKMAAIGLLIDMENS